MRDNLAAVRDDVNPIYAERIDNGEIEKKFVSFYIDKFSKNSDFLANHTAQSNLTDKEKKPIVNSIKNLAVKEEKH